MNVAKRAPCPLAMVDIAQRNVRHRRHSQCLCRLPRGQCRAADAGARLNPSRTRFGKSPIIDWIILPGESPLAHGSGCGMTKQSQMKRQRNLHGD
jgi:hypothetical protein